MSYTVLVSIAIVLFLALNIFVLFIVISWVYLFNNRDIKEIEIQLDSDDLAGTEVGGEYSYAPK